MLSLRRLRWLGHVRRMNHERIPRELLYGELAQGSRTAGRPVLRFKDVAKRDLKDADIDIDIWETLAADRQAWRNIIHMGKRVAENRRRSELEEKRRQRKSRKGELQPSNFICHGCGKDCHARIGLASHSRLCKKL